MTFLNQHRPQAHLTVLQVPSRLGESGALPGLSGPAQGSPWLRTSSGHRAYQALSVCLSVTQPADPLKLGPGRRQGAHNQSPCTSPLPELKAGFPISLVGGTPESGTQ